MKIFGLDFKHYTGVSDNSKRVRKGEIFIAIKGEKHDSHDYIPEAIKNGAKAIVIDEERADVRASISKDIHVVMVGDSKGAGEYIAGEFYKDLPRTLIAVTGTNGKTSVTFFTQQLLNKMSKKTACIGSNGIILKNEVVTGSVFDSYTSLTTPGFIELRKLLQALRKEKKVKFVAMEASSHGLEQARLKGLELKAAAFTSFSQDHLDYHKTMQNYLEAKMLLFRDNMKEGAFAISNSDLQDFVKEEIKDACEEGKVAIHEYGKNADFLKLKSITYENNHTKVEVLVDNNKTYEFKTNLVGEFQIANLLCAAGIAIKLGSDAKKTFSLIQDLKPVPGRMQQVEDKNIFIDNSHTPDALENALKALRKHMQNTKNFGKLIVVFGCGGNRDETKREIMGQIACEFADQVIVTDDNPRFETPDAIRKQILQGCKKNTKEIPDRKEAIESTIKTAGKEDFLLIAGRGCETHQSIRGQKVEFDDYLVALGAL